MTEHPMPEGLTRADPAEPGFTRRRRGRGWSFLDEDGAPITDVELVSRLKALVIPPAWQDVWISPDDRGHIQSIGTDAAGRRQYRYHDDWRTARDVVKHDRVLSLGSRLADVRAEVVKRLGEPGLSRDRVLAGGVRMLDLGVFRAGGEEYAHDDNEDGTFGLATLRRDHVRLRRGALLFSYPAKGGILRAISLKDALLHKVVNSLLRRRGGGDDLLAYRLGRTTWHDVRAEDLNAAVKELAGEDHTCKDLRTWNATVLAAVTLAKGVEDAGMPRAERARKRAVTQTVKTVSEHLGNTPTVCRASYIDPRVLERFEDGRTILPALKRLGGPVPVVMDDETKAAVERAVVKLISA